MGHDDEKTEEQNPSFDFLNDDAAPPPLQSADSVTDNAASAAVDAERMQPSSAPTASSAPAAGSQSASAASTVYPAATVQLSRAAWSGIVGYCVVVTLVLLGLLVTGRIVVRPNHPLESLPDVRPLQENEYRSVPADADLPDGHVLRLGDSERYGDVVLTPTRVTREPLQFAGFLSNEVDESLTTEPVLKLWLEFRNAASSYAFPPLDASLIVSRSPRDGTSEDTRANAFLNIVSDRSQLPIRLLHYLNSPDSNFRIVGQNAGEVLNPGETVTTFIASAENVPEMSAEADCTWRIQFRKGVSSTGSGVTTLVDVLFQPDQIESIPPAE
jgi:hypothetical protein